MVAAVDTVRPQWRDPEYGYRLAQVRRWRQDRPDRPLVLVIGSSRTQMGVSPADMGFADEPGSPLVYNFGQSAAAPLQLLLTLLRVLDDGVRPDYLLVELFPAALVYDGPAEKLLEPFWVPRLGSGDLRRLAPYVGDPAVLRRSVAAARVNPWYSFRHFLLSHVAPRWQHPLARKNYLWGFDEYGWLPYPAEEVPDGLRARGAGQARSGYGPSLASFEPGRACDRALRDIIDRCRAEGIPLAFYLTPEGPEFRSWYTPAARERIAAYVGSLAGPHGIPVLDAADGFAEEEFADSHHLLRHGAVHFSRRLADEGIRPWLRRLAR